MKRRVYICAAPLRSITLTSIIQRKSAAPRGFALLGCGCCARQLCRRKSLRNNERAANKIVSPGCLCTMQKRWRRLIATLQLIVQRNTIRPPFLPSCSIFIYQTRGFSFVSGVIWRALIRSPEMKRRFRRKLICNCCRSVRKYRWILPDVNTLWMR